MSGVTSFTDLRCWKSARDFSKRIFQRAKSGSFAADRRLIEQINDSSESVMSNIAEGFGRGTQAEFVTFLGYALGSLDETRSHLCAAYDREYLSKNEFAELWELGTDVRKMTVGFIRSMVQPGRGVKHTRNHENWNERVWEIYERTTGRQRPAIFEAARTSERERPVYHDEIPVDREEDGSKKDKTDPG